MTHRWMKYGRQSIAVLFKFRRKAVTVSGPRGRKRLTYPFWNDGLFIAAVELA